MAACFFGITDKGKRRDNNEDTFIVQELPGTQLLLACVIDGVGGYNGGEVAAEIARTVILEKFENISEDIIETLRLAVVTANERIQQQRHTDKENAGMACVLTCVIADKKNNRLWYAHVGDTRLYLLRDENLIKISSDHSAVGFLEESGRLSELDAMQHPRRNEIDRALGFEAAIAESDDYIETGESPFLPGDTILLCSDGLSDMIGSGEITAILNSEQSLPTKAKQLIDAANAAGGNDNITAVIVENNKRPKKLQALKPVLVETGKEESASGNKTVVKRLPVGKRINKRGLLICLALFLFAIMIVAFIQRKQLKREGVTVKPGVSKDARLLQLINVVNDSAKSHSLSPGTALVLNEAIQVNKDSFYLNGNGLHLIADTNYKGPAFIISNTAKNIVLDSLVLENFDCGLVIQKSNVIFKNVRFINCKVPVQYAATFSDTSLSGRFKDSIFITTKSLKK
ncbi:MAG: serine/threonine-protein phosphatase [Ferruginibacter sp.]|nr:serine/threonine-protein phosphatase [Ferruginibacter sp.]